MHEDVRRNRRVLLASRPQGEPVADNFGFDEVPVPELKPGQMLLRTLWLSLDPYMRGRMYAATSYAPSVDVGAVMVGSAISEVVSSRLEGFSVGDLVVGSTGWQEYTVSEGLGVTRIDQELLPGTAALGVMGMPSKAAYFGLAHCSDLKAGETLVVSAASGAVGSIVGQIGRIKGARVIGIAGTEEKCHYLRDTLGFDSAVNHRSSTFAADLSEVCPVGIDVYFDNVGGDVLSAVVPLLNKFARIAVCGNVANKASVQSSAPDRLPAFMRAILVKRLSVRGFLVGDFSHLEAEFNRQMAAWVREGRVRYREQIVEGLEAAPQALIGMLRGENFGKLLVRVGDR